MINMKYGLYLINKKNKIVDCVLPNLTKKETIDLVDNLLNPRDDNYNQIKIIIKK